VSALSLRYTSQLTEDSSGAVRVQFENGQHELDGFDHWSPVASETSGLHDAQLIVKTPSTTPTLSSGSPGKPRFSPPMPSHRVHKPTSRGVSPSDRILHHLKINPPDSPRIAMPIPTHSLQLQRSPNASVYLPGRPETPPMYKTKPIWPLTDPEQAGLFRHFVQNLAIWVRN